LLCSTCNKQYRTRSGLWKHADKCIPVKNTKDSILQADEYKNIIKVQNEIIIGLIDKLNTFM
jgi:hypothetical protein